MVSVHADYPEFVLDGDVDTYIQLADPPDRTRQRLEAATGDDRIRLLARAWGRQFHGSDRESKRLFVLLMEEEGIPFGGEDIQAITTDPPVRTQT